MLPWRNGIYCLFCSISIEINLFIHLSDTQNKFYHHMWILHFNIYIQYALAIFILPLLFLLPHSSFISFSSTSPALPLVIMSSSLLLQLRPVSASMQYMFVLGWMVYFTQQSNLQFRYFYPKDIISFLWLSKIPLCISTVFSLSILLVGT